MALSEQEQRALREIEQSLMADDPKFGSSVSSVGSGGAGVGLKAVAIGVVGLLLLIGGVALAQSSLWFIALSVLGFLVMFAAGVWALRSSRTQEHADVRIAAGGSKHPNQSKDSGIGARMEENFRRRFDGA
ncbi:DUF3040 domain-containing protein [Corynebacterium tapiri]|uniref:DUF3040 domain-containing protein n=1 Tax=Corynebacterium tapiri TaxID=1448266 RepID=A0A5C4U5B0_9CORY|nr:DUF3040 domain-containing protein [Corynebacterium tapiri]TNL99470.1 DUF3040 domain-containing protein [Corynebacterium tapiri]